jgi:hypothetical protein
MRRSGLTTLGYSWVFSGVFSTLASLFSLFDDIAVFKENVLQYGLPLWRVTREKLQIHGTGRYFLLGPRS